MLFTRLSRSAKSRPAAARPRPVARLSLEALGDRIVPASLSVGDATIVEGNAGTQYALVSVTLSGRTTKTVTVNYGTADGTATAGSDYDSASGKLTFAPGETAKTIRVPVRGDRLPELDEAFFVRLAVPKGAKIARDQGTVTVADNEPRVSVSGSSLRELNSGTVPMTFEVRLASAYDLPVTVSYATADGTATAGADYSATLGTLTFAPGETRQTVTVQVHGDRLPELDETVYVNASTSDSYAQITWGKGVAFIRDDEPRIWIGDAWNTGESTFTFTVSLSAAYDEAVTVDFTTTDGTAVAGVDYLAATGALTFAPGETTKTITVEVVDPTSVPDKYLYVRLGGASANALIGDELGQGVWYYDYGYYDGGSSGWDPGPGDVGITP